MSTSQQQQGKKRVRISQEPAEVQGQPTEAISEKEKSESWWTQTEYAEAKDSVKRLCRGHRQARRYSDCLSDAYVTACTMASAGDDQEETGHPTQHPLLHTTADTTAGNADNTIGNNDLPPEGLLRWVENQGPRGLEGYSSSLHAMRRQGHLRDTKHAVFLEQARQRTFLNERDEDLLAQQAEMSSRRARTFATLLGQADAWAVTCPDDLCGGDDDDCGETPLPPPERTARRVSDDSSQQEEQQQSSNDKEEDAAS